MAKQEFTIKNTTKNQQKPKNGPKQQPKAKIIGYINKQGVHTNER